MNCPFCKEEDFDAWGLKLHLLNNWCEVFGETRDPRDITPPPAGETLRAALEPRKDETK